MHGAVYTALTRRDVAGVLVTFLRGGVGVLRGADGGESPLTFLSVW